jgi:DNA-binding response OmpR family regulator
VDSGLPAVQLVTTEQYALVVLDLILPGLDGVSVLKRIIEAKPDQKVMVLSGVGGTDSKVQCLELGAVDYITKPFSVEELLARVSARLREAAPTQHERYMRRNGVTLDMARRKVDTGRGEIGLTEREFVLLAHLMSENGKVFSRQELLSEVWGFSFDPGSNIVDVYIRRLRTKLGESLIETVRNVGYSLRVS